MASFRILPALSVPIILLLAGCLAPAHVEASDDNVAPPTGNAYQAGFDLTGAGWVAIDIPAEEAMDLRFRLTHETIHDLCVSSQEGRGIYDQGHHTVVHLWRLGGDPFVDGRFLAWLGNPHMALPVLQTGVCGESSALHLEPGETARLIVGSSLPGYRIELLGDDATHAPAFEPVALAPHPEHRMDAPIATATIDQSAVAPVVVLDRDWRSVHNGGPALFYGVPWIHVKAHDDAPTGGFQIFGKTDWGFDGAIEHVAHTVYPQWRGAIGTETHWTAVFGGWTDGGHVESYVTDEYAAGAYAGEHDAGARFLSVPLGAH